MSEYADPYIHYYLHGRISSFVVKKPLILGHECSGEIVEVGCDVSRLEVGQRVVIEPEFVCEKCPYCRSGRYNLCRNVKFYGTPPFNDLRGICITVSEQKVQPDSR